MTKVKFDDTELEYDDEEILGRDEFDYFDYYDELEDTLTIDIDAINEQINGGDRSE